MSSLSPPPATYRPGPWDRPLAPAARPAGVTFACVASMVLGVLGCITGLFFFAFASAMGIIPIVGPFFAAFGLFFGVLWMGMGVLGLVAGAQGLQGRMWARWMMVTLFGLGALTTLTLLVPAAVCIGGIVGLFVGGAEEWFDGQPRYVHVQ